MTTPTKGAMSAIQPIFDYLIAPGDVSEKEKQEIARIIDAHTHAAELEQCLRDIVSDLPTRRDWLNPDTEKRARALLAKLEGGK